MSKLLVIGLDCATPQLLFDAWLSELPNLRRLIDNGIHGELKSCIPPITVPAWTAMLSSKDPGQLGFYGFRNRKSYRYEELYFANASYNKAKMAWEYLGENGLTSILIGVPQTYPPKPVRGKMVGCFLTPDKACEYTYPADLKEEIDRIADGDYIIDVKDFRTDNKDWLLKQIYLMTERRFKVVRHYMRHSAWDFLMFVEMGVDRIHHSFWRYQDRNHRLYEPGNPYENAIRDYYRYVDGEIGSLLECMEPDTAVMVVSDHGAKSMEGAICINEWLMQKGYLCLKNPLDQPCKLTVDMIDWSRTKAWGEGGYYARIFLNVQGREPEGVIRPDECEAFRDRLKGELEELGDEEGRAIGTRVFKPEEVYRSVGNIAPDLIVYFGDLNWRAAGKIGTGTVHIYENDTGPDDSNHAEHGVFIFTPEPGRLSEVACNPGRKVQGLSIFDVAPTILNYFGIASPADMIGRSVLQGASACVAQAASGSAEACVEEYKEEDEEIIRQRLEDLGYL